MTMFYFFKEFSQLIKAKKNNDRKMQEIIATKKELENKLQVLESIEKELRQLENRAF